MQKCLVKGGPSSFSSHLPQGLVQAVAAPKTATAASSNQLLDWMTHTYQALSTLLDLHSAQK